MVIQPTTSCPSKTAARAMSMPVPNQTNPTPWRCWLAVCGKVVRTNGSTVSFVWWVREARETRGGSSVFSEELIGRWRKALLGVSGDDVAGMAFFLHLHTRHIITANSQECLTPSSD